jgi:hypothetical protein
VRPEGLVHLKKKSSNNNNNNNNNKTAYIVTKWQLGVTGKERGT